MHQIRTTGNPGDFARVIKSSSLRRNGFAIEARGVSVARSSVLSPTSGDFARVNKSASLRRNGFAVDARGVSVAGSVLSPTSGDFEVEARGVSVAGSVLSPTSDRTKIGLSASKSGLKGFSDLIGVDHRCHQCDESIFGSAGT